jgi:hypothetical protein
MKKELVVKAADAGIIIAFVIYVIIAISVFG